MQTATQASLGDVGIRVVLPKKLSPQGYNIVNRNNIMKKVL